MPRVGGEGFEVALVAGRGSKRGFGANAGLEVVAGVAGKKKKERGECSDILAILLAKLQDVNKKFCKLKILIGKKF